MSKDKVLVIVGPTASGKTSLAIDIAENYNGEIICADSMTIYKRMDIGTAKPSTGERHGIKHYLLDLIEPGEDFSAADFKNNCQKAVESIKKKSKIPIIVGGSGLYIDAYLYDYKFRDSKINIDADKMTADEIKEMAKNMYPDEYDDIGSANTLRLIQLIERGPANKNDRDTIKIECKIVGIMPKKLILKQNIEQRTNLMLNNGIVQEVEFIRQKYGKNCKSLTSVGYRQVCDYLDGRLKYEDLQDAIVGATMNLAKRQYTWFKRNKQIDWAQTIQEAQQLCSEYLI